MTVPPVTDVEYEDRQVPTDKEDAAVAGAGVCPMAASLVRADG